MMSIAGTGRFFIAVAFFHILYKYSKKSQLSLKGQYNEIFDSRFFGKKLLGFSDSWVKAVSNMV
jgi:hypothetical protein